MLRSRTAAFISRIPNFVLRISFFVTLLPWTHGLRTDWIRFTTTLNRMRFLAKVVNLHFSFLRFLVCTESLNWQTSSMSLPFHKKFADPIWLLQQQGEYLQLELLRSCKNSGTEWINFILRCNILSFDWESRRLDQVSDFNLEEHKRNFYQIEDTTWTCGRVVSANFTLFQLVTVKELSLRLLEEQLIVDDIPIFPKNPKRPVCLSLYLGSHPKLLQRSFLRR